VAFIRQAHAKEREVHVWTVNRPDKMRLFMDRGADNLITDHPFEARSAREQRTGQDELRGALMRVFGR
jgi:glycerophosphoryl diester phosphodiesterase